MVELDNSPSMEVSLAPAETNPVISFDNQTTPPVTTAKPRRKLPGMPDPDAEVVALSPRTLLATNRFVCEVCNKGFQRDQNLQLHRRGHNLPWKLRQRTSGQEVRKRVYVCPEPNCVHHDPARALGDLSGIKKHFFRKHGEKKWRCERCSKKYAVQSDWKAHMKTCGTREYRCDCGILFSRRDSFITHRAFCDVLTEESTRCQPGLATTSSSQTAAAAFKAPMSVPKTLSSSPPPPLTPSTCVISPVLSIQSSELPETQQTVVLRQQPAATVSLSSATTADCSSLSACSSGVFSSMVASSSVGLITKSSSSHSPSSYSELICAMADSERTTMEPVSLSLSSSLYVSNNNSSLFPATDQDHRSHFLQQTALSATALLQKAAKMGATSSTSFLRGLGLSVSSSSGNQDVNGISPNTAAMSNDTATTTKQWIGHVKQEESNSRGCGLGLPSDSGSNIREMEIGPSTLFGNRPTTLDLLSLGIGNSGTTVTVGGGFDVALASFGGGLSAGGQTWESPPDNKPSLL